MKRDCSAYIACVLQKMQSSLAAILYVVQQSLRIPDLLAVERFLEDKPTVKSSILGKAAG